MKVLYFARLREDLECSEEDLELPLGVSTVAQLRAHLIARGGAWKTAFTANRSLRVAVNQDIATAATPIGPADEVAFFPPVTGG